MEWAEENIGALIEERSELLRMIAHQQRHSPAMHHRFAVPVKARGDYLAQLKRRLTEIEACLSDAGLSFGG